MLQLTYSPRVSTTILADRRWGTDIYYCEPVSCCEAGTNFDPGRRWQCQGGYGATPSWRWDYSTGGYSRGLRPLADVMARLHDKMAPKINYLPDFLCALERQAKSQIEELIRRADAEAATNRTVADLLRHPAGRAACRKCAEAGKAYSAEATHFARQSVVRAAVALLRERMARREAAKRQAPESGRIVRLARERAAARREQLHKDIEAMVLSAATGLYRTAGAGDHSARVTLGQHPSASGDTSKGDRYSSRCTYRKTDSHHSYTVRDTWEQDVYDRDLEYLDGMLTLDAEPIQGHGPELFRAVWAEQGRGMSIRTVRGYIARDPATGITYHAASARAAIDGLARKLGTKPPRRQGTVDLTRLVRRHGDLPVHWGDHDGIACDSGTRSWCAAVGIDVESGCTVADVVAGYRLRPHPEALQIVRRVVRDRHNRQPLDLSVPESAN